MDCTLNHTKVECAVGYPFLGSNVEVSLHSSVLCNILVIFFLSLLLLIKDVM